MGADLDRAIDEWHEAGCPSDIEGEDAEYLWEDEGGK